MNESYEPKLYQKLLTLVSKVVKIICYQNKSYVGKSDQKFFLQKFCIKLVKKSCESNLLVSLKSR